MDIAYVLMIDAVERQWHTASICAAVQGNQVEPWAEVLERFDEYLSGAVKPVTEEEAKRRALGLS